MESENKLPFVMKPSRNIGIAGYGAYVPRYRLPATEVARVWAGGKTGGLPIKEKAVAGQDEDVITMSIEAARNALTCESKGEAEEASEWRHIEDAMKMMRGPHQS